VWLLYGCRRIAVSAAGALVERRRASVSSPERSKASVSRCLISLPKMTEIYNVTILLLTNVMKEIYNKGGDLTCELGKKRQVTLEKSIKRVTF
jgi:hypothetical protein